MESSFLLRFMHELNIKLQIESFILILLPKKFFLEAAFILLLMLNEGASMDYVKRCPTFRFYRRMCTSISNSLQMKFPKSSSYANKV